MSTTNAKEDVHVAVDAQPDVEKDIALTDQVDLSQYDFTEEENRALNRKLDWHVSVLGTQFDRR